MRLGLKPEKTTFRVVDKMSMIPKDWLGREEDKEGKKETAPTMRTSFVQEVAEVEQGVSRGQELEKSLHKRAHTVLIIMISYLMHFLCRVVSEEISMRCDHSIE